MLATPEKRAVLAGLQSAPKDMLAAVAAERKEVLVSPCAGHSTICLPHQVKFAAYEAQSRLINFDVSTRVTSFLQQKAAVMRAMTYLASTGQMNSVDQTPHPTWAEANSRDPHTRDPLNVKLWELSIAPYFISDPDLIALYTVMSNGQTWKIHHQNPDVLASHFRCNEGGQGGRWNCGGSLPSSPLFFSLVAEHLHRVLWPIAHILHCHVMQTQLLLCPRSIPFVCEWGLHWYDARMHNPPLYCRICFWFEWWGFTSRPPAPNGFPRTRRLD